MGEAALAVLEKPMTWNTDTGEVTLTVKQVKGCVARGTDPDKITLQDQDLGDYVITIDISGSPTNMDTSLFGDPGTTKLYQFSCPDTNTLSLKVIAVEDMDLAPLIFTRVP